MIFILLAKRGAAAATAAAVAKGMSMERGVESPC